MRTKEINIKHTVNAGKPVDRANAGGNKTRGEKMKTFIIKNNHMKMYYYNKCREHGWVTLWVGNGFICMGKKRGGE